MSTQSTIFTDSWLTDLPTTAPENQSLSTCTTRDVRHKNTQTLPPRAKPITKRKSRASKKTHTTYITADPANFRQMVQQVTGVQFNCMHMHEQPVVRRPEPQRAVGGVTRFYGDNGMPRLDTSELVTDHVGDGAGADSGVEFDMFGGAFPTLESSFSRVVEGGYVTF